MCAYIHTHIHPPTHTSQALKVLSLLGANEKDDEELRVCCHEEQRFPFFFFLDDHLLGQHRRLGNLEGYLGSRRGQKVKVVESRQSRATPHISW